MSYILLIILILSAVYHQSMFILIPTLAGVYFYLRNSSKIILNSFTKAFIILFATVLFFLIVQSGLKLSIDYVSVKETFKIFTYICIAIIGATISLKQIEKFIFLSLITNIFLIPFTFNNIDPSGGYMGVFQHSNHLAYTIIIGMYFLFYHINLNTLLKSIILILSGFIVLYTKTTGAILILGILLFYELTISNKVKLKYKVLFLLGPIFLMIPVFYIFSDKIIEQINSLNVLTWEYINRRIETGKSGGYGSVVWRIVYWLQILHEFDKESFLKQFFGVGIGSMSKGFYPYKVVYKDPHNDFLKIIVEYGYLGVTLFILFLNKLYGLVKYNFSLIVMTLIPLFFDNMIVNFSIMITLILTLAYEYRIKN